MSVNLNASCCPFISPSSKQSLHHQLYGICKGKGQSFAICVFCILVRCVNVDTKNFFYMYVNGIERERIDQMAHLSKH